MSEIKEIIYRKIHGVYKFDKRELLKLSDGGQIMVEYKFVDAIDSLSENVKMRPIVLIVPGITGCNDRGYVACTINEAIKRNMNVVFINHRGLSGAPLLTPKLFSAGSWTDAEQAVQHVH